MPELALLERAERRHAGGYVPKYPSKARWARQCTAKTRHGARQGKRCGRWAIPGGYVCVKHGGKAPQTLAVAQRRLMGMVPGALTVIEELLNAKDQRVQLRAALILLRLSGLIQPVQRKSRARGQDPVTMPEQKVLDAVAELEEAA